MASPPSNPDFFIYPPTVLNSIRMSMFGRRLRISNSECRRAQDAQRDIPVPLSPGVRRQPLRPGSPRSGSRRRHDESSVGTVGRRHDPTTHGLTACWVCLLRHRHAGRTPAPTPTGNYRPSLRSPWPAAGAERFIRYSHILAAVDAIALTRVAALAGPLRLWWPSLARAWAKRPTRSASAW